MARQLRIEYEGAWYHVMNRGAGRKNIFLYNKHRFKFLDLLSDIHERYQVEIHAYCLMGNHYHLLIRTPLANLSRAMKHLDGVYVQYFNVLQQTDGPLFRGRFKSIIIEAKTYLLKLSRYIHLNPVEAGFVKRAEDYRWSSYNAYINNEKSPTYLVTGNTLNEFGKRSQIKKYRAFIEAGVDEEMETYFNLMKRDPFLGSVAFKEYLSENYLEDKHKIYDIPEHKCLAKLPELETIFMVVSKYYDVSVDSLKKSRAHKIRAPRRMAIYIAFRFDQYGFQSISEQISVVKKSSLSQMVSRFHIKISKVGPLKKQLRDLLELLKL